MDSLTSKITGGYDDGVYWKVSVLEGEHYYVKACSLTKEEAVMLSSIWMKMGFLTRISPH